jgi:glycyl-tRNA synthetase beta chain
LNDTIASRIDAFKRVRHSEEFKALAALFKRVKNITSGTIDDGRDLNELKAVLKEPAELALADAMIVRWPLFEKAISAKRFSEMVDLIAELQPFVDRFFKDVLVMADDASLRDARLTLLARLHRVVRQNIGDISEMAPDDTKQA